MEDSMPNEQDGSQTPSPEPKPDQAPDMGNMVNSAVTAHLKRFTEKQLPSLFESAMKPILEQMAALKTAPREPAPDEGGSGKPGKANAPDPTVVALQQQLEEMKRTATLSEERRQAAEKKSRDDRAFSDLKSHLAKAVRPEMLDMVSNHLFQIQKMVEVSEDGTAYFKGQRTIAPGLVDEVNYPLKDGVENWLKSEEAKAFIPSPGTSNTPATRRQTIMPGALPKDMDLSKATPQQKLQHAAEMEQNLTQILKSSGLNL